MKLSDLGSSANDLLESFGTELALIPGFTLPGNRYVGAGEIPWDKPGLYLYVGDGSTGQPGAPQGQNIQSAQGVIFRVSFFVMILRTVATFGYWNDGGINPASDAVLNANGTQAVRDAGALLSCAAKIKKQDLAVKSQSAGFVIGQVLPLGPQGGMAAMRLQLDVSIDEP
jgi:hypothetical protein